MNLCHVGFALFCTAKRGHTTASTVCVVSRKVSRSDMKRARPHSFSVTSSASVHPCLCLTHYLYTTSLSTRLYLPLSTTLPPPC